MNASQEDRVRLQHSMYQAIIDVMNEDYEVWIQMSKEELVHQVMVRSRGQANPKVVRQIIEDL